MRNLNLDEISEKISDYSSDILYSDRNHLEIKIDQLFNFLNEQPISKRTLERIEEDFKNLNDKRIEIRNSRKINQLKDEFISSLTTREIQGAFAYFELKDKFEVKGKNTNFYIELASEWYKVVGEYNEWQEYFNCYFFTPFKELIEWYFRESKIKQEYDFFSKEEIKKLEGNFELLNNQIEKLDYGQEIIFNEVDEIKNLIKGLNKKNWKEVIEGKFHNLILDKFISFEMAEQLINIMTGENVNLK